MHIQITEHKSVGTLDRFGSSVRVFVNRDFHYGYFVNEQKLFDILTEEQQAEYLHGNTATLDVTPQIAQQIIDMGATPYNKAKVI